MTTAIQNTPTRIDEAWLAGNRNEKAGLSVLERIIDYSGRAGGAFREIQVLKGLAKIRNGIGMDPSPVAQVLEGATGAAMSSLGLIRLPSSTQDAVARLVDLSKDNGVSSERKVGLAIRGVGEAITTWVYASIFLTGKTTFLGLAQFADLAGNGADLALSAVDYKKALDCEASASGEVKKAFTHTKNYNMLRIAKAIVSVVSAILAVIMLLTGSTLLPTMAMILISITSALLAIRRDIHKDEGLYRVISFDHPVLV